MLVSQSIPSMVGGVSQQPPALRLPSNCEIADNCFPSLVNGLAKRPPSNSIAYLQSGLTDVYPFVHFINRDGSEKYVMLFDGNGTFQVYNLDTGVPYFTQIISDSSYLIEGTAGARKCFKAVTLADTTYFLNTSVTTAMTSTVSSAAVQNMAIVWVKEGNFNQTYVININNALAATYTTPATGTVGTDSIAAGLAASLTAHGFTSPTWGVGHNGSFLFVNMASGGAFQIDTLDSAGGTSISVVQNQVNAFADLPPSAVDGMIVKVTGDLSSTQDAAAYYVTFVSNSFNVIGPILYPQGGTWQECTAVGIKNGIDTSTMPHAITRMVDTNGSITGTAGAIYFSFTRAGWNSRTCGDANSAPQPSFIGSPLNELFFYQDRLGFLSATNVVLSQSGNFTNFWRQTALQLQDDDPIDVSAAHPRVVQLRHAVPWAQQLVIFGDLVQFVFGPATGASTLSPSSVQMVATTEYDADPWCNPIPIQNLLYFPYVMNGYVGVREFYVEYYTQKHVGNPVAEHIPKYMPGNPIQMANCQAAEMFAVLADQDPGSIFIYKWKWVGNTLYSADKAQSCWVRWNFDQPNVTTQVISIKFYAQTMYMVILRTMNGTASIFLEKISVDDMQADVSQLNSFAGQPEPPLIPGYLTHLDRRMADSQLSGARYDSVHNTTSFTIPAGVTLNPATVQVVTRPESTYTGDVGNPLTIVSLTGTTLVLAGQVQVPFWVGELYTMRYRFSPFLIRDSQQQGPAQPNLQGRLQIRTLTIRTTYTGYYRIEITAKDRAMNTVPVTMHTLGSNNTPLGSVPGMIENQQFRTLIGSRNDYLTIDLVNDSPMPSRFTSAEWEGLYYARARRM